MLSLQQALLVAVAAGGACVVVAVSSAVVVSPLLLRYRSDGLRDVAVGAHLRFNLRVHLHSVLLWLSGVSSKLEVLPEVAELPGDVIRVLGSNPSRMTLRGTNTYLVGRGSRRLLIDSSDGNDAYMSTLLRVCDQHGVHEITDLLLTHGHYDHMGGLLRLKARFPKLRVWKYLPEQGQEGDGDGDRRLHVSNAESRRLGISALRDGAVFRIPSEGKEDQQGAVLRAVYTPGHYNDHVCFLLEDPVKPEGPVLFSGDCILGLGSCVFDSLVDLMASLTKLQACRAVTIYPGHGPVVSDAPSKILEYISHRQQREAEVLAALETHSKDTRGLSSAEIVAQIYEDLPFTLRLAARKAVDKHLVKLLVERRVQLIDRDGWFESATYRLV